MAWYVGGILRTFHLSYSSLFPYTLVLNNTSYQQSSHSLGKWSRYHPLIQFADSYMGAVCISSHLKM